MFLVSPRADGPDSPDAATVVATGPDGACLGKAIVTRLYGARGTVLIELPALNRVLSGPQRELCLALIEEAERQARRRGLMRLELDVHMIHPAIVVVLVERAQQLDVPLSLSWPTTPW